MAYLWKPLPSIRTTIHVLGSRMSGCSKSLTYSNLTEVSRISLVLGFQPFLLGVCHVFEPRGLELKRLDLRSESFCAAIATRTK